MRLNWLAIALLAMAVPIVSSSSSRAYGAAPQAPGYGDRPGWDAPPSEFREVQRQGFHDGIEGARRDFDHHRRPDVDRREEYRHPHVDRAVREDYQEGYRRGYEMAMHHLMGETRY